MNMTLKMKSYSFLALRTILQNHFKKSVEAESYRLYRLHRRAPDTINSTVGPVCKLCPVPAVWEQTYQYHISDTLGRNVLIA